MDARSRTNTTVSRGNCPGCSAPVAIISIKQAVSGRTAIYLVDCSDAFLIIWINIRPIANTLITLKIISKHPFFWLRKFVQNKCLCTYYTDILQKIKRKSNICSKNFFLFPSL